MALNRFSTCFPIKECLPCPNAIVSLRAAVEIRGALTLLIDTNRMFSVTPFGFVTMFVQVNLFQTLALLSNVSLLTLTSRLFIRAKIFLSALHEGSAVIIDWVTGVAQCQVLSSRWRHKEEEQKNQGHFCKSCRKTGDNNTTVFDNCRRGAETVIVLFNYKKLAFFVCKASGLACNNWQHCYYLNVVINFLFPPSVFIIKHFFSHFFNPMWLSLLVTISSSHPSFFFS